MYIFNRVTVVPQLPKRVNKLSEIANNLWWSWNSEFLRLLKIIDKDLWERCWRNPVKVLKLINQERIEKIAQDNDFLQQDCFEKVEDIQSDNDFEYLSYSTIQDNNIINLIILVGKLLFY